MNECGEWLNCAVTSYVVSRAYYKVMMTKRFFAVKQQGKQRRPTSLGNGLIMLKTTLFILINKKLRKKITYSFV